MKGFLVKTVLLGVATNESNWRKTWESQANQKGSLGNQKMQVGKKDEVQRDNGSIPNSLKLTNLENL